MSRPLIRPFAGYVPRADLIEEVVAPPVANITTARYEQLVADHPQSILHLLASAIDSGTGGGDTRMFDQRAAARLREMIADGVLEAHPVAFYILVIETEEAAHTGIVCEVDTAGLDDGRIKRHENTRADTEQLIVDHLTIVGAHTDPVAMTYRAHPELADAISEIIAGREPLRRFTADDGSVQSMWAVADAPTVRHLEMLVAAIPALYITDGHHRTAAAARLAKRRAAANPDHIGSEPYNYLLTVLFAESELTLHGYNRSVNDLGGVDAATVLDRIREVGEVEEISVAWAEEARPRSSGVVAMLLDGRWYRVTFRPEKVPPDARGSLDAALLQDLILGPVLGISDARRDHRLQYVPGPAGLAELEHHEAAVGFALHAATVSDVMAVADEGAVMPPKSTWFAPKVMTGLVVRRI